MGVEHESNSSGGDFKPRWGGGKGEGKHQTPGKPQGVGGFFEKPFFFLKNHFIFQKMHLLV